jgi:hypothetical protein
MTDYPTLNFPPIRLRARRSANGRTEIFDAVRGRWLVLTPEEWVRRHVVEYLRSACRFQPQLIVEEHPVNINGMAQRADVVVMGEDMQPLMVVECKEPNVKIGDEVLRQVVRYNSVLRCRYIALTNGLTTYCYEYDGTKYSPCESFPCAK